MRCPIDGVRACCKEECAWYCNDEGCAIKLIALQLVKIEEKMG